MAFVRRACETAVDRALLTGAGVTVLGDGDGLTGHKGLVHGTDGVIHRLEDVQVVVGDGPCLLACATGRPCELDDVVGATASRWPLLCAEARRAGVGAVFCFPLRAGTGCLGTLFGYRGHRGALTAGQRTVMTAVADRTGEYLADAVGRWAVAEADLPPGEVGVPPPAGRYVPVHTAAGMLGERWGLPIDDALVRIRAEALSRGCSVLDVAHAVLSRRIDLDPA